jgi:hypothetical protein
MTSPLLTKSSLSFFKDMTGIDNAYQFVKAKLVPGTRMSSVLL